MRTRLATIVEKVYIAVSPYLPKLQGVRQNVKHCKTKRKTL